VHDLSGSLKGVVTVEHLNRCLSEWHDEERKTKKARSAQRLLSIAYE
jgi:hypothetical protein